MKLGDKVRDTITDIKGTAVARCEYITGCIQFEVQPKDLHNGQMVKAYWIDEIRLEIVPKPKPRAKPVYARPRYSSAGGPQSEPVQNTPPSSVQCDEETQ